jgi:Ser/Thr protein kinase RdoA (MazF antagonist)
MSDCLNEALSLYGIKNANTTLLRHNENRTYRIDCDKKSFCLRLKTPVSGFDLSVFNCDSEALLQAELTLIKALGEQTDVLVQKPIETLSGNIVAHLSDGTLVSLLTWMDGVPLTEEKHSEKVLISAGQTLAKLRDVMETKFKESVFSRFSYNQELVKRLIVKAEQGTEYLPEKAIHGIIKALNTVSSIMDEMDDDENILIAHSDPGLGNMIWTSEGVGLIDWSLAGYAHSYMDIGGLIGATSNRNEQKLLLNGWESVRGKINRRYLDAYFALAVLLFVCCQYSRSKEWTDWFPAALKRWHETIFEPLSSGYEISCIL